MDKTKMERGFLMNFILEKSFLISTFELKTLFIEPSHLTEDNRFKFVYELAEKQALKKQELSPDANFNLIDSIKADLAEIIRAVNFSRMTRIFLMDFVAAKGFLLYPAEFAKILCYKGYGSIDFVYELAEKQALKKQEIFPNENFNLTNSIKTDLSIVISGTKWYKMEKNDLMRFVSKGIITEEQANHVCDIRVTITNNGKTTTGIFKDEIGIREEIRKHTSGSRNRRENKCITMQSNTNKSRFLKLKFNIPKTKSTLKKIKGVEWYLCLEKDGVLTFKHKKLVNPSDYLIAEMKAEIEFALTTNKS